MSAGMAAVVLSVSAMTGQIGTDIISTPHNLSAGGPGTIRAASESEICIFCHTPHDAAPVRPLWNRTMPLDAYTVYKSSALDAEPGQPTGASKMCLSCHDGTIALGAVVSRDTPIVMSGGVTVMPPGVAGYLGTDLSDDHPVSFVYDPTLVSHDPKLADPGLLPPQITLDKNGEVQCTSCHEPHNNIFGDFLVMPNATSQLCTSCHRIDATTVMPHKDCAACHQSHSAASGPYLLRAATITDTCLVCHAARGQGPDVATDVRKISAHFTITPVDQSDPIPDHVTCADCHDPHTMELGKSSAPDVHPVLGQVTAVNSSGTMIEPAMYEYEVCYKCHADQAATQPFITRQVTLNNTRLEFDASAVSNHPVEAPGRSLDVPSLIPPWTVSSVMYCTDCHASDSSGTSGPHGSAIRPLLKLRYDTGDYVSESYEAYSLCYSCHSRDSILSDVTYAGHRLHIVEQRAPCSVCHDAHGVSAAQGTQMNNARLMNFDTSAVFPDPETGLLRFEQTGFRSGQCFLSCHGQSHSPKSYN